MPKSQIAKVLFPARPKPVVLLVMDGWGVQKPDDGNAISLARTPRFNELVSRYPVGLLKASGEAVGLPAGIKLWAPVACATRNCRKSINKLAPANFLKTRP